MASESTPPKLPHLTPRKKALSMAYSPLVSLNKAGYYTPISGGGTLNMLYFGLRQPFPVVANDRFSLGSPMNM